MVLAGSVGPRSIITHAQRVARLYKKVRQEAPQCRTEVYPRFVQSYRCLENWSSDSKAQFRVDATILRARFDETNKVKVIYCHSLVRCQL